MIQKDSKYLKILNLDIYLEWFIGIYEKNTFKMIFLKTKNSKMSQFYHFFFKVRHFILFSVKYRLCIICKSLLLRIALTFSTDTTAY